MRRRPFRVTTEAALMVLLLVCVLLPLALGATGRVVQEFLRYSAPSAQERQTITDDVTVQLTPAP